MDEYIERKAVLKIIADNCPHDKGGYNTEEEMGAGAACYYIRKDVDNIPAADVVPKSEVEEEIVRAIKVIGEIVTGHIESDNSLTEAEIDIVLYLAELKKKYTKGGAE